MTKTANVCKICRRFRTKLFLKGEKCFSPKCSLTKRSYGPGIHGQARHRMTEYALQLAEKQKAKAIYGIRERQFKKYYFNAAKTKVNTADALITILETRLDNIVYRLGFASSRPQSRQMIKHGKILVNDQKINIPSYNVKVKDIIKPKNKNIILEKIELPVWLSLDKKNLQGEVVKLPQKKDIPLNFSEEMIIEYYSR